MRTLRQNTYAVVVAAAISFTAILSAPVSARAQGDAKTYSLTQKFKLGDVFRLKIVSKMKMEMTTESGQSPFPGGDINMSVLMKNKTVKINEDGTADMEGTVISGTMDMLGNTMDMPQSPPVKTTVDKYGDIKKIDSSNQTGAGAAFLSTMNPTNMSSTTVIFPKNPVKVGESWTSEVTSPFGAKKGTSTGKLVAVETLNGTSVYRISMDIAFPMEMMIGMDGQPTTDAGSAMMAMSGKMTTTGDVWVDASNGQLVKGDQKMKSDMVMEMKGPAAAQSPFGSKMLMKMSGGITTTRGSEADEKPTGTAPKPASPVTKKPVGKPL